MKKHHLFLFWKQHAIKIGATVLTGCMLFAVPAQAAEPFTDVPSNHWAAGVIEELRTLGFSDGIGDNQFGLGQTITRAQFAAFIAKVQGYSGTYPQAYTDNTDANAWYYGALNAMAANRVTSPDGAFRPNDPITRAEMTEMMIGALGFYDLGSQLNQVNCPFTDVTDRKGYITLASDLGLAGGMSATTFAPQASAASRNIPLDSIGTIANSKPSNPASIAISKCFATPSRSDGETGNAQVLKVIGLCIKKLLL